MRAVWGCMLFAAATTAASALGLQAELKVEIRLYKVAAPITDVSLPESANNLHSPESSVDLVTEGPMRQDIGGVALFMDGPTLTWDGKPKPDAAGIETIAEPTVVLKNGALGNVSIGQDAGLQYLERKKKGLYEMKEEPQAPGTRLSFKPTLSGDDSEFSLEFRVDSWWLVGRDPVPGTTLNVGKPIIRKCPLVIDMSRLKLGNWIYSRSKLPDGDMLYLFVRVTKALEENPTGESESFGLYLSVQPRVFSLKAGAEAALASQFPLPSGAGQAYLVGVGDRNALQATLKKLTEADDASMSAMPKITVSLSHAVPKRAGMYGVSETASVNAGGSASNTGSSNEDCLRAQEEFFRTFRPYAAVPPVQSGWSAAADVTVFESAGEKLGAGILAAVRAYRTASDAVELNLVFQIASKTDFREAWGTALLHPGQDVYLYLPEFDGKPVFATMTIDGVDEFAPILPGSPAAAQ